MEALSRNGKILMVLLEGDQLTKLIHFPSPEWNGDCEKIESAVFLLSVVGGTSET